MLLGSWAGEEGAGGEPACIFKGKVEFLKLKLDLLTQYPEQEEVINHEINEIEDALDEGINNKLDEAINTDVKGEVNYG